MSFVGLHLCVCDDGMSHCVSECLSKSIERHARIHKHFVLSFSFMESSIIKPYTRLSKQRNTTKTTATSTTMQCNACIINYLLFRLETKNWFFLRNGEKPSVIISLFQFSFDLSLFHCVYCCLFFFLLSV